MIMTENKTVRSIRDILNEGENAFAEGVPLEACPYKPSEAELQFQCLNEAKLRLWNLGWQAARDEAAAASDPLLKQD